MAHATTGTPETGAPVIELWLADLAALAGPLAALDDAAPLLSDAERAEAAAGTGLGREQDRHTARLALRLLIARMFGEAFARAPFASGPHGKPALAGLAGDFNLAHSGGHALIGLGHVAEIGVDLETARDVRLTEARRAALADAGTRVAGGTPLPDGEDARTLQAWVRLEALGKAEGLGIGRTLARLGVWGHSGAHRPQALARELPLAVHDVAAGPACHAAVALPRGLVPPAVRVLPAETAALASLRAGPAVSGKFRR